MSGYELSNITDQQDESQRKLRQNDKSNNLLGVTVVGHREHNNSSQYDRPLDRYNLVFIILLTHGIGTLMPWNMFINAENYFRSYKLQMPQNASQSDIGEHQLNIYRDNFLSYLGLAAQVPNLLFNGLNLLVNMGSGNLNLRVNVALVVEALVFTITIILAVVDSSNWPGAFFCATMLTVVILNMASGIYQNCVFGIGAKFPGSYTNAILIGSNTSGTFTSIVNLITISLAPKDNEAAIYYFITALVVIIVCLVSYNLLHTNKFFRYHGEIDQRSRELEIDCSVPLTRASDNRDQQAPAIKNNSDVPVALKETLDAMVPRQSNSDDDNSFHAELIKKWNVFKKCWPQCLNVFLTFYVTLALFPAVLADIKPFTKGEVADKYFVSFATFFLFNASAMGGNLISGCTTWPGKDRVWIIVLLRFLFVPYFLYCNFKPETRKWQVLIGNDLAYMFGNIFLALSSGYLSSLCMMFASSDLPPSEAPKAGMLAAFFLVLGIFLGINSSFILTKIVDIGF